MWLECHHRSAWKYHYAGCNYTLFFLGSAKFRRRISPVLSPQQVAPHRDLPGFTRVTCSAHQARSKAEQWQVTRTSSFRPSGEAFFLSTCRRVRQSFSSRSVQIWKMRLPKIPFQPYKTGHPLIPFYQTVSGKRKTFFFCKNKKPLQLKKKCFRLLIVNFYLKQILSFKTKRFF